ncbi:hypothetical protein ZBT109_1574 [Zymobacter palmae]|uniref:Uncharacterized protein n=1 Tax=Zymobacter palmae TaxID=33074 RepID=A0A348HFC9_9GAMM|nr:hypothetical protein ZBT109_1574 [Zymobacter palmae]
MISASPGAEGGNAGFMLLVMTEVTVLICSG